MLKNLLVVKILRQLQMLNIGFSNTHTPVKIGQMYKIILAIIKCRQRQADQYLRSLNAGI
jgi:hypothetical protein